jgi:hypothetical protein
MRVETKNLRKPFQRLLNVILRDDGAADRLKAACAFETRYVGVQQDFHFATSINHF